MDIELLRQELSRQADLIPLEILDERITIVGAGAIGSNVALLLAKAGFANITVWDFDTVDVVNLNSQFYSRDQVGQLKVIALYENVAQFTGIQIKPVPRVYEGDVAFPGIVIFAVDSMKVRKLLWEAHKTLGVYTKYIIDARMGGETALLYTMSPDDEVDIKAYESTLYTDESAVQEPCTMRATGYTAACLSGMVVKAVKDVCLLEFIDKQTKSGAMDWVDYDRRYDELSAAYPRTLMWDIKGGNWMRYGAPKPEDEESSGPGEPSTTISQDLAEADALQRLSRYIPVPQEAQRGVRVAHIRETNTDASTYRFYYETAPGIATNAAIRAMTTMPPPIDRDEMQAASDFLPPPIG